jgi:hypothetical protein
VTCPQITRITRVVLGRISRISGRSLRCYRTYRAYRSVCTISPGQIAYLIGAPILYANACVLALRIESVYSAPRQPVQMLYSVTCVKSPTTGEGFIYLPGRGEEGWRRNVMAILRSGQDGKVASRRF